MMAEIEPPASTKPTTTAYNRLRAWNGNYPRKSVRDPITAEMQAHSA